MKISPLVLTDASLLGSLGERNPLFSCTLNPKIFLSFCSCHLCPLLFSTHGYQAKEVFEEDNGDYWCSQNCHQNIGILSLSKHLEPGVPQTMIFAAYHVGELCSGVLCSLSWLASGAAVSKQALAFLTQKVTTKCSL